MKLFIASDIHGSMYYCNKMLNAWDCEKADKLVLLGDILYHGPRNDLPEDYNPKAVIDVLNEISDKIICVRGNCDTEVDQMVLKFPMLAQYSVIFDSNTVIYLSHGHNNEILEENLSKGSFLLCGHTHIPACETRGKYVYLNPGSVSIPKENSQHGYMIYEDGMFFWKNLDGEIFSTLKAGEYNEN